MPRLEIITCDICGKPAKVVYGFRDQYLCDKHFATREITWLIEDLKEVLQKSTIDCKNDLEQLINQFEIKLDINN